MVDTKIPSRLGYLKNIESKKAQIIIFDHHQKSMKI